jgi:phosphatidylinositol glycan class C protein
MNSSNSNTSNSNRRLWLSPEDLSNLTSCNNNNNYNRRSNKNNRTTEDDEKEKKGATTRKRSVDTYETIFNHFSLKPKPKSLILLLSNTMVFVQEFVLTCLLLAGHRAALLEELDYRRRREQLGSSSGSGSGTSSPSVSIHSTRLLTSLGLIWLTLIVAVVKNRFANSKRYTIRHRFTDFLLMAILLRFLSAVLKTLTASYSSDTVYVLSTVSLFLHLVTCNYDYANGYDDDDNNNVDNVDDDENNDDDAIIASNRKKNQERPTFKGGMISLTSAFFATTLLASRLESNAAVYIFICSSVVLFALYPAARHLVAVKSRHVGKWSKS